MRSTTTAETYDFQSIDCSWTSILEAVVIARKYDVSHALTLLHESLAPILGTLGSAPYLNFVFWAVAGLEDKLSAAADLTLRPGVDPISRVNRYTSDFCKRYAGPSWTQLLEYHHRHFQAPAILHKSILSITHPPRLDVQYHHIPNSQDPVPCTSTINDPIGFIFDSLLAAKTVEELLAFYDGDYGMSSCLLCMQSATDLLEERMQWLEGFGNTYEWIDDGLIDV